MVCIFRLQTGNKNMLAGACIFPFPENIYIFKINNDDANDVVLLPLLLTLNIFHTFF